MLHSARVLATVLLLLAAAPGSPGTPRDADLALARASAARDAAAFRALLDPRCLFGGPAGWAEGPDAALDRWRPFLSPGGPTLAWTPETSETSSSGDLAYTTGRWRSERKDAGGGVVSSEGRYVTVWRRPPGGAWRVLVDVALLPVPGAAAGRATAWTFASSAGDLEATAGTYEREGARGLWLLVRRREAGGAWTTAVETELPRTR